MRHGAEHASHLAARVRTTIKSLALLTLSASGAMRLAEFLARRNLHVLTYHRVIPRGSGPAGQRPPNTLFVDEFERQMAFLSDRYRVLNGDELRALIEGRRAATPYSAVITFDDGYENNYTHALPILQRHGLHAIFFVTTSFIGTKGRLFWFDRLDRLLSTVPPHEILVALIHLEPSLESASVAQIRRWFKCLTHSHQSDVLDSLERRFERRAHPLEDTTCYGMMSWDQVRELSSRGMTIGSHTANHQILSAVRPVEVQMEVVSSRERIQDETQQPCLYFAYPNGQRQDFRPADEEAVQDAGYLCAFTQIEGSIGGDSSLFALRRIPIPDVGDMRIFRSHLCGLKRIVRA